MKEKFGLEMDNYGYYVAGNYNVTSAGKNISYRFNLYDTVYIKKDYNDHRVKGAKIAGLRARIIRFLPANGVSKERAEVLLMRDMNVHDVFDHDYVPLNWLEIREK